MMKAARAPFTDQSDPGASSRPTNSDEEPQPVSLQGPQEVQPFDYGTIRPQMADSSNDQPRQRWQILFARHEPALRLRQAELLGEFERSFRESGLPLSQSNAAAHGPA